MTFINMNLDDAKEATIAPESEYDLVIDNATFGESKNGKPQIVCYIAIEDHPEFRSIRHNVSMPAPEDDADKARFKKLMLKRFMHMFSIPWGGDGINVEDFLGARTRGLVKQGEPNPDTGDIYNELVVPRLPDGV